MQNPYLQEVTALIRKQQGPRGPVWMCGEQLLEMITPDEAAAKLVLDDLQHGGMSIKGCEADIRAFACKNGGCCTGTEAEKIIRKYFGLPEQVEAPKPKPEPQPAAPPAPVGDIVNLEDFFG